MDWPVIVVGGVVRHVVIADICWAGRRRWGQRRGVVVVASANRAEARCRGVDIDTWPVAVDVVKPLLGVGADALTVSDVVSHGEDRPAGAGFGGRGGVALPKTCRRPATVGWRGGAASAQGWPDSSPAGGPRSGGVGCGGDGAPAVQPTPLRPAGDSKDVLNDEHR